MTDAIKKATVPQLRSALVEAERNVELARNKWFEADKYREKLLNEIKSRAILMDGQ